MGLKEYFRKIVLICYQNEDEDGPIASSLTAMSTRDSSGNPVSLIGSDVAKLIKTRGVWVLFFPTGGDGAAPWSGIVIYDTTFRGDGQVDSTGRVGLVAHELTHVLQRDRNHDHYWPSGCIRPSRFTRWITDSTN